MSCFGQLRLRCLAILITWILITHCDRVYPSADLLRGVVVPQYAFVGGSANLSCEYDLQQTKLYSLKWYHNKTEFYRYIPTEPRGPINIRPNHKFILKEMSRSERLIILNLSRLTPFASGEYRCEIIAEHPSYRTEALFGTMTVLREHLYPPRIVGAEEYYDPDDVIEIRCRPHLPIRSGPRPSIKWYLNGQMVPPDRVSNYGSSARDNPSVVLSLSAQEVLDAGGTSEVECRLILGNHQEKTARIIRVRTRHITNVNNFYSGSSQLSEFLLPAIVYFLFLFV